MSASILAAKIILYLQYYEYYVEALIAALLNIDKVKFTYLCQYILQMIFLSRQQTNFSCILRR